MDATHPAAGKLAHQSSHNQSLTNPHINSHSHTSIPQPAHPPTWSHKNKNPFVRVHLPSHSVFIRACLHDSPQETGAQGLTIIVFPRHWWIKWNNHDRACTCARAHTHKTHTVSHARTLARAHTNTIFASVCLSLSIFLPSTLYLSPSCSFARTKSNPWTVAPHA